MSADRLAELICDLVAETDTYELIDSYENDEEMFYFDTINMLIERPSDIYDYLESLSENPEYTERVLNLMKEIKINFM